MVATMVKSMTARISGAYQLLIKTDALMQTATVGQMTTTHSTWIPQWSDEDGDGYGDEPSGFQADDCLNWAGTSNQDGVFGCADGDGDGWADQIDGWDTNPALWSDSDFDGYADQRGDPLESDDCPNEYGKSTIFYLGCPDMDNDGWPDMKDGDTDGDGYLNHKADSESPSIHDLVDSIGCRWKLCRRP